MVESALVSMAQQFSGLPMDALIGAPLKAAAEANAMMAMTQTKFILDTGFGQKPKVGPDGKALNVKGKPFDSKKKKDDPDYASPAYTYDPVMIEMTLVRGVITPGANPGEPAVIQNVTTTFRLPLITIIPINSLGVDNVNIEFEMEVKSSFSEETSDETTKQFKGETSFESKFSLGPFSASVRGSASYDQKDSSTHSTHYQKSNSAKYTVLVHAGQLPIPGGIQTIIQAYANAIQPIELPTPPPAPGAAAA